MNDYLDTQKSVIISSPAGSGKTEKLARRYIALLEGGVAVERILAITFTDKAAAEMKQRILRILKHENRELFNRLLDTMSLMRVSTVHSFCGTLLRRFSFEAGIDANYTIENDIDSRITWDVILHSLLMNIGTGGDGHDLFLESISENGFRGINTLKELITGLFERRPFSTDAVVPEYRGGDLLWKTADELKSWGGAHEALSIYAELFEGTSFEKILSMEAAFLTQNKSLRKRAPKECKGIEDYQNWALTMHTLWREVHLRKDLLKTARIRDIFQRCLQEYTIRKRAASILDFSDLEYIAYKMLTENPDWANILYAFDEKTDHILVDEFQDTNSFQWGIIDRLTEEWRSGLGAKREEGIRPTIFFVGDEKQSIYFFRGANVEIFHKAKEQFRTWLGEEFCYEEVTENYRCLPAIVDFTNILFSAIMAPGEAGPDWMTRYSPFTACRKNNGGDRGRVEIVLLNDDGASAADLRKREAETIAGRVRALAGSEELSERGTGRKRVCTYEDIAILLRKRTHLKLYEEAFSVNNIPFVAVRGIGFYQESEVAILRSLVYFLSNPGDDYSLYVLLKSPFFHCDESALRAALRRQGGSLFSKLQESDSGRTQITEAVAALKEWLFMARNTPLSEVIEHVLVRTAAWKHFCDEQRRANIKKFIRLIEDLEADGRSIFRIRAFLESTCDEGREPKANVNSEGMNAVKIMTIHAAKGLEFPVVLIPGIDEQFLGKSREALLYEKDGSLFVKTVSESSLRAADDDYRIHAEKELEEQKRLLYVAATRAENVLLLTGYWNEKENNVLSFLKYGLGLERDEGTFRSKVDIDGLVFMTEQDIAGFPVRPQSAARKRKPAHAEFIPLSYDPVKQWRAVTGQYDTRGGHGESWEIPGNVIHRILEEVSKATIIESDTEDRVRTLFAAGGFDAHETEDMLSIIKGQIAALKREEIWANVILPRDGAFTELPFVLETGDAIYRGRIDRVIRKDNTYYVYDYKTFPVKEQDLGQLVSEYTFQLTIYKKAVQVIFDTDAVKSYIIFTHNGWIKEV